MTKSAESPYLVLRVKEDEAVALERKCLSDLTAGRWRNTKHARARFPKKKRRGRKALDRRSVMTAIFTWFGQVFLIARRENSASIAIAIASTIPTHAAKERIINRARELSEQHRELGVLR